MDDRELIKCAEDTDKEQKFKQIIDAQQNDYKNKVIAHQESQKALHELVKQGHENEKI